MNSKLETPNSKLSHPELVRGLTLIAAMSVVVGNVIGTGVFLKARVMTCNVGTPGKVLGVYVIAGLLTAIAFILGIAQLGPVPVLAPSVSWLYWTGLIGGLISFGVVGLFVGPVMLAATYTLAKDWVARVPRPM